MSTSRLRKRVYLLVAALLTTIAVFGCAHTNLGPWELGDIPETGFPDYPDTPDEVQVSLKAVRVHNVDIEFASIMYWSSVDVMLWDERGVPVETTRSFFSDGRTMTISFPSRFCTTYGLKVLAGAEDQYNNILEEDVLIEVPMGPNPYDFDMSASCNADAAISPVFTDEVDGMILAGDDAAGASGVKSMGKADVENDLIWYTDGSDYYDGADRMILIPEMVGVGTTGAAKLFMSQRNQKRLYTLEVWSSYDPIFEEPHSVFTHESFNAIEELIGPFDAGDLNGDGARELIVTGQRSTSDENLLQRVFLLKGPIFAGTDAELSDAAVLSPMIGTLYDIQKPLVSVGDIDADGFDDLASISHRVSDQGETSNWHVDIFHGDENLTNLFRSLFMSTVVGSLGREIVEVGHGDFNGDGIDDLIIADAWKMYIYGAMRLKRPRVLVFFGRSGLGDLRADNADIVINVNLSNNMFLHDLRARSVGDMNGDGIEDLTIGLVEENSYDTVGQSDVYVVLGRGMWSESIRIAQYSTNPLQWALRVVSGSGARVILEDDYWDSRVGDVDNDGYYDLMLKVEDFTGRHVLLYPGSDSLEMFGGVLVELDEAEATWSFSAP
jgi:hypothetical protein